MPRGWYARAARARSRPCLSPLATSIVDSACGYAALTMAAADGEVVTAEFKINFMWPALGDRVRAIGRVKSAGRLPTVCTGEVRAFSEAGADDKVVALMQATMVSVRPSARRAAKGHEVDPPGRRANSGVRSTKVVQ